MSFLRALFFSREKSKRKDYPNIRRDQDPLEVWQTVGELGDGAFGKVYKAENKESGLLSALKKVPINDDTELEDFMVEIDILAEYKHSNVVGLHEAYFFDSQLWIFIEFCPGGAMDDIILELEHGLSEPQIRCTTKQLFQALDFLHDQKVIHRDLKAGNLLLCPDGTIRLGDFGVSAMMKMKEKRFTFIGTPYWMAPEVVACETVREEPYDVSADVWSAGITLIELADMNPPHHEMNPMRVLLKITRQPPPTLMVPSKWSKDFSNFIARCLVKLPAGRATSKQLLQDPFIKDIADYQPLRALFSEVRAPVEVTIEDLPEDIKDTDSATETEELGESSLLSTPVEPKAPFPGDASVSIPSTTEDESEEEKLVTEPTPEPGVDEPAKERSDISPSPKKEDEPSDELPVKESTPEEVPLEHKPKEEEQPPEEKEATETVAPTSTPTIVQTPPEEKAAPSTTRKKSPGVPGFGPDPFDEGSEDYKYQTLQRKRTFQGADGKQVTTTTTHIVQVSKEEKTVQKTLQYTKRHQEMRKAELREMKVLQRLEMKEATEFFNKITLERDVQEKKFEQEKQDLDQKYRIELDSHRKKLTKELEKTEQQQLQQYKSVVKQLKSDQAKELKRYKEAQKKQEKEETKKVEKATPKKEVKQKVATLKQDIESRRKDQDLSFQQKMKEEYEKELQHLVQQQRRQMRDIEITYIQMEQDAKRRRENELWEMERRQKQENHHMLKQQVREAFHMQRHQMQNRHQKEYDHQMRRDAFEEEDMKQRHLFESKQLPRQIKAEYKHQTAELKKTMKLKRTAQDRATLRKLEMDYMSREASEKTLMTERHMKELEDFRNQVENAKQETLDIQAEKKSMLTQQETSKVNERDDIYAKELSEWRRELNQRKQLLEDQFRSQREEKEQFYSSPAPLKHHERYIVTRSLSVGSAEGSRLSTIDINLESISSTLSSISNIDGVMVADGTD